MAKTVVVAYDGSQESRNGLLGFCNFASTADVQVYLIAVVQVSTRELVSETYLPHASVDEEAARYESILNEGRSILEARGYRVSAHLTSGDPTEHIARFADEKHADLIVIGHKRRASLAQRWWHRSVGASLIERAHCNVLVAISN